MIRAISLKFNDWINGMISLESIDVARMTIQFPAHELNANPMNYVETLVYLIRWIWQWMLNFGEYTQYGLNDVQTWKANCLGNNIRLENFL